MVVVIFTKQRNPRTGQMEQIASHGVDTDTNRAVTLPSISAQELGAVFNRDLTEYVLPR